MQVEKEYMTRQWKTSSPDWYRQWGVTDNVMANTESLVFFYKATAV